MDHKQHQIIVLYVLVALLVAWIVYVTAAQREQDVWVCSSVVCSKVIGPQEWESQNCFETADDEGNLRPVCRVTIDGVPRIVPRADLNLSGVQGCGQYSCVQEVRARAVNYTLDVSPAE